MRRGWVRYLAAGSCLAVLAYGAPEPVGADGNAGLHIHKTVDPLQVTLTPGIGVALGVDKASSIPGDTLTYTAVVTNPIATFAMGGDINAQAVADTDSTVAYYWDELQYCAQGCGTGAADPHWTALAAAEAAQPGYQPITLPAVHTGMNLAAASVTRSGVKYPASGDPILGTEISPSATAAWTYRSTIVLTPPQMALLGNPLQASAIRNVLHFEVTSRNTAAAQPYTDPEPFSNPLVSASNPGAIRGVTVTFTLPDGSTTAVAGPATLNPGGSASVSARFGVPVPAPRGAGETEARYVTRLQGIESSSLSASAVASGGGFGGPVYAASPTVSTQESLPIVTIAKSGPTAVNAGDTETNPLSLQNSGGALASSLSVVDTIPSAASGTVSGTPSTLAPGVSAAATAAYVVPASQVAGDLTDTASVTWKDANGNPYGSLSSSFTTQVHNVLFGARLTLAPTTAGPNAPGTKQTLTATLLDSHSSPIAGQVVHFTVTGANATSGTGTTDPAGKASFTYTGSNSGNDVAQAAVTALGLNITSNTSAISWLKVLQPVVTTEVQGNFFANPANSCTFDVGPSSTPVFTQSFPDILFNPASSVVPHDISSVTNFTRPLTDLTVDVNGNYNGQVVAQGNGQQAGAGSLINFYGVFTGSFVISQPGDLTFRILHDDGYIIGVGNGATRVSGDLEGNPPATTPFNGYGVVGAWNTGSSGSSSSGPVTVHFPAAGTYPYELDYTECGAGALFLDLLTAQFIAQTSPLSIYVGYADALRPGGSAFPFPWDGSPNTIFEGCSCSFDAGAIRFDNDSPDPMTFDSVTVDIGTNHFDLWPHGITLPPAGILVITETSDDNFDTSDQTSSPCFTNNGVIPQVNVTIAGTTTTYRDSNQVLNTTGFDQACIHSETHPWENIAGSASAINLPLPPSVSLNLTPFNVPSAIQGQPLALTVSALDGAGNPEANLPVGIQVNGANSQTLSGTTNAAGLVTMSYSGAFAGADTVEASAFIGGLRSTSNVGSVTWISPGGNSSPLAPSISNPTPADGSVITKPVAVDASITPPSGQSITGWRVFYQPLSGGPVVVIGSGTGAPPSPLGVTFDPTLVADGAYRVTVEATADNGAVQDISSGISVIGGLKLGRYTTSFQDLSVPVIGFQMQVLRTYDSTDSSSGDFGTGWRVDVSNFRVSSNHELGAGGWTQYNKSCTLGLCFTAFKNTAPRFITVVYPDQHSEIFDFVPDGGTNIFWSCTPIFKARDSIGSSSTLVPLDDTGCSYTGDGNIYGSNGVYNPQLFKLTTRAGQVLVIDHLHGLVSTTDRNGNTVSVDASGVHASNGQSIAYTRDSSHRITTITGPAGQTVTYDYSGAGDLVSSTDPLGGVNTYTYDSGHHLLRVAGPQGAISNEAYDASGRLVSITDAKGQTSQIQNDVGTQSEVVSDANGSTTTVLTSDSLGDIVREDISSGGKTLTLKTSYDSVGHVIQQTDALGNSVNAAFDTQGDLVSYTDALGEVTVLTYNDHGQLTSVVAPDGTPLQVATYDGSGNLTSEIGAGGAVVHFSYDSTGRPVSRTDATGATVDYSYDSAGHMTQLTNASGSPLNFSYDTGGRLSSVTDALGETEAFSFDAAGNLIGTTDPLGNKQSFQYGPLGRVTSATDALGRTTTATYDADGNLTSSTNRDGQTTTYTYDADGNLTRINYPGGEFVSYTLDGFGRPVTIANTSSTIDNTYDAAGHLVGTTTNASSIGSVSLSYTYDAAGNRLSSTGPDGTVGYAYDSRGRVTRVTDQHGGVFGLQYDTASRLIGMSRPNGIADSYSYDADGRRIGIASTLSGTPVQSLTQTLDANGQVTSRSDASGTTVFTHDALGRLTSSTGPVTQSYSYDGAGNRTSGPLSSSNAHNAADELVSDGSFTYTYDAEGERTTRTDRLSGATTNYSYNGARQLTAIQYPDGTRTTYAYDALGRRLSVSQGGVTTAYVYDGVNARLEYGGGSLAASYVGTGEVDSPLEMTRGSSPYYYLQDLQGSVTRLTNAAGSSVASYAYDAFGVPGGPQSTIANPFTYAGREYDSKSGLYYNRARFYEPTTGSFLSADPVSSGQPYAYAAGDPVDYSDPSGAYAFADFALTWTRWTAGFVQNITAFACALAGGTAAIEIGLDFISQQAPKASSLAAIGAGVAVSCAFAALGLGAQSLGALIVIPLLAGFVAGLVDLLLQIQCASASNNQASVSKTHAVEVGLVATGITAGAAVLGAAAEIAAGNELTTALGTTLLSGDAAALADLKLQGGACG